MEYLNFFSTKTEGKELSNFYLGNVIIDGRMYKSGECAFHGSKFLLIGRNCVDEERKIELIEYGMQFECCGAFGDMPSNLVKRKGGNAGKRLNEEEIILWEILGIEIQRKICKFKYLNDDIVKNALDNTKNKVLVHPALRCREENVNKRMWNGKAVIEDGELKIIGHNTLGKLWMEIRDN